MDYMQLNPSNLPATLFVKTQPISKKRIEEFNPQIIRIYGGKKGEVTFVPIAEKVSGTAIGSICRKENDQRVPPRCWMAKVGSPLGMLRNNPMSINSRALAEMNLHTILEKIAIDLFQELGQGLFEMPKTRLAKMPIMDVFTYNSHPSVRFTHDQGTTHTLRVASRYVDEYHDFEHVRTEHCSFIDYITKFRRSPEKVLTPDGKLVPLTGFCGLLGVGRVLADTDVIGGSGGNAGVRWIRNENGIITAAQTVKIDPGFAFQFAGKDNVNWAINKRERRLGTFQLEDLKDLQIANNDDRITIEWKALTQEQQDSYLSALLNCARYLQNDNILQFLFFRDAKFNRAATERIPTEIANGLAEQMQAWMIWQLEIYQEEIQKYQLRHPEHPLRIHYIDNWGELELPMANEKFLVRDLFTELSIVSAKDQQAIESEAKQKSSLEQSFARLHANHKTIALNELFTSEEGTTVRKILLTGAAGIGKSTLCQKIAHDWASDRLFQGKFKAVYWIPLRLLNSAVSPGGALHGLAGHEEFLAKILAIFVLNQPELEGAFCQQIRSNRMEVLILLDGYDEAQPLLRNALKSLMDDPEMHIILTSRPGVTEGLEPYFQRTVENLGFADRHVEGYCRRFFTRRDDNPLTQQRRTSFLAAIKEHSFLEQVAHIPLQLQMLCSLWEQGAEGSDLATSVTTLYGGMIDQLFRWQCRKKNQDPLAIPAAYKKSLYTALGQIGDHSLREGRLMLPQLQITNILEEYNLTEKDFLESGLLKATGSGLNTHYHFLHLTFQEYLIARWISRESPVDQRAFILNNRNKTRYRLVIAFLAGLIYHADGTATKSITNTFFETLCEGFKLEHDLEEDYIEDPTPELFLILRCLNECTDYSGPLSALNRLCDDSLHNLRWWEPFDRDGSEEMQIGYWLASEGLFSALKWFTKQTGPAILQHRFVVSITNLAAQKGNLNMLCWLFQQDPKLLLGVNGTGTDAFVEATKNGHLEVMQWLHRLDPMLIQKVDNYDGKTPMHYAATYGRLEAMQWLHLQDPTLIQKVDKSGDTVIHSVVALWHYRCRGMAVIEWLHQQDPALIQKGNNNGKTPMHLPEYLGWLEAVQWLHLQNPTLIQQVDKNGANTMHVAATYCKLEVMQWLHLQDPALIQQVDKNGANTMHIAATYGKLKVMQWLHLQDPALIQQVDKNGANTVHIAAQNRQLEAMQWLHLQDPSLIQKVDNDGKTAMHWAADRGPLEAMQWLHLQDPSLIQKVDKSGNTVMHSAAAGWWAKASIQWLHQQDPKLIQNVNSSGETVMHRAAKRGSLKAMQWLHLQNPTLIQQVDKNGANTMHVAATYCKLEAVQWLHLQDPSLIGRVDKNGKTAAQYAMDFANQKGDQKKIRDWLQKAAPPQPISTSKMRHEKYKNECLIL